MDRNYKYDAFITYRHLSPDKPIAEKLQKLLEGYVPPKGIGKAGQRLHLFRDQTELPTSDDLGTSIREALAQSRYLIVVCSAETEKSRWCMEEIEFFKSLHGYSNKNILTLLCSPDGTVTFPETLRFETVMVEDEDGYHSERREIEPLAANVSAPTLAQSQKKLKTEFLRLAAALYGCSYDELYRRDQKRQSRRRVTIAVTVAAILAVISLASIAALFTISSQKTQIENDIRELNISQAKSLVKESVELEKNGDLYGALASSVQSLELSRKESIPMQNTAVSQATKLSGAYKDEIFTAVAKFDQKDTINDFVMLDGGKRLFSTDYTNSYLWDTETGKKIKSFDIPSTDISIYKDTTIESGELKIINEGILSYDVKGNVILNIDKARIIPNGKRVADNAVYFSNNDTDKKECTVCKLDPEDGSNAWEYTIKDDSIYSLSNTTSDGVTVITYEKNALVLSPKDGSLIASIDLNELKKRVGNSFYSLLYQNDHLAVCYEIENKLQLDLYKRENSSFKFLWNKQILQNDNDKMILDYKLKICDNCVLFAIENSDMLFATACFQAFNIKDGSEICSINGSNETEGGKVLIEAIPKGSEEIENNIAVAALGNQFMVVNTDNGDTICNMLLPDNVLQMRISDKGYILYTDAGGNEVIAYIPNIIKNNAKNIFYLINDFRSKLEDVSSCNEVYAVTDYSKTTVALYRTVKNKNASPVIISGQKDGEKITYSYQLSPGKTKAAIKQKDANSKTDTPQSVLIIDAKSNSALCTISPKSFISEIDFLSDEKLVIKLTNSVLIYDAETGKQISEIKDKEYNIRKCTFCSKTEKIYFTDTDYKKLYSYDGESDPTVIFDAKENDINSIGDFYVSPDGSHIAIKVISKKLQTQIISFTPEDKKSVTLYTKGDSYLKIDTACWSPDGKELRILSNDSVSIFDCEKGVQIETQKHNCNIANIVDIDGTLCLLDIKGNLIKTSKENGKYTETESVNLTIDKPSYASELSFTSYSDDSGLLSYGDKKAWLFDKNSFEIITPIEDCTEINTDTNEIIICYDSKLTSYPLLSAEETCDFAKDVLVQTDEE